MRKRPLIKEVMICQFAAFCNNYVKRTMKVYTPSETVCSSLNNGHKVIPLASWELPLVSNETFYYSTNTVYRCLFLQNVYSCCSTVFDAAAASLSCRSSQL